MPESSLRWGGRLGALGAGLGVFAYIFGALITPLSSQQNTGEVVITIVLIRGLFVLVALGVVLGLAYYGGLRVARETVGGFGGAAVSPGVSMDRIPSAVAGGLVVLIYWLVTRLVGLLIAFAPSSRLTLQELGGQFVLGVLFVLIGAGLGGFGARTASGSRLSETVIVTRTAPPVPQSPYARSASSGFEQPSSPEA